MGSKNKIRKKRVFEYEGKFYQAKSINYDDMTAKLSEYGKEPFSMDIKDSRIRVFGDWRISIITVPIEKLRELEPKEIERLKLLYE